MKDFIAAVAIAVLASGLWGTEYARRGLWEPDEARYAYIAREMAWSGNRFVVTRHGQPYSDKPPLMFWLINGFATITSGKIDGVTARLPSLAGVLLSLLATYCLASAWGGRPAAAVSALVLSTSFLFWQTGGMGQLDALLCGLQMAGLCLLHADSERPAWWRALCAYFAMGLAVLQKGPIGLVIPIGMHVAGCLAVGERFRLRRWHWIWGSVAAACLPVLWLALAGMEGGTGDYLRDLLFGQVVRRVASGTGHNHNILYFAHQFPLSFLPWTLVLPAACMALARSGAGRFHFRRLAAWAGFVLVFFSIPADKRNLYVLAAFPPCAMLIGLASGELALAPEKLRKATMFAMSGLMFLGGCAALAAALPRFGLPVRVWSAIPIAIILGAGGCVSLLACRRWGMTLRWLVVCAAFFLAAQTWAAAFLYHDLNALKTPWELARASREMGSPDTPLLIYKINGEILAFYAQRQGVRVDDLASLQKEADRIKRGLIVLEERHWQEVSRLDAALGPHRFRMGGKRMMWVEFSPRQMEPAEGPDGRRQGGGPAEAGGQQGGEQNVGAD